MPVAQEATESCRKVDSPGCERFPFPPDGKRISFPMAPVSVDGFGCGPDERMNNPDGTIYVSRGSCWNVNGFFGCGEFRRELRHFNEIMDVNMNRSMIMAVNWFF